MLWAGVYPVHVAGTKLGIHEAEHSAHARVRRRRIHLRDFAANGQQRFDVLGAPFLVLSARSSFDVDRLLPCYCSIQKCELSSCQAFVLLVDHLVDHLMEMRNTRFLVASRWRKPCPNPCGDEIRREERTAGPTGAVTPAFLVAPDGGYSPRVCSLFRTQLEATDPGEHSRQCRRCREQRAAASIDGGATRLSGNGARATFDFGAPRSAASSRWSLGPRAMPGSI